LRAEDGKQEIYLEWPYLTAIDYKPQGGFISILRLEVCVICFSVQDFNMYCLKSEPHR